MTRRKIGWMKNKVVWKKDRLRLRLRLSKKNTKIRIALKYAPLIKRPPQLRGAAVLSGMKRAYMLRPYHTQVFRAPTAATCP
jgi:hypothetical protein